MGSKPLVGRVLLVGIGATCGQLALHFRNHGYRERALEAITTYRDLDVWQLSMDLVDRVHADTNAMPRINFDLKRQIRRAVISIPSNVAEGWRRKGRRQAYQNHVSIAMRSHGELETQLEVCCRNGFLNREEAVRALGLMRRVGPMLERLHASLD